MGRLRKLCGELSQHLAEFNKYSGGNLNGQVIRKSEIYMAIETQYPRNYFYLFKEEFGEVD
jgi:hypothetical protein